MFSTLLTTLSHWFQNQPLWAAGALALGVFLLTMLGMLVALKRHGHRRFSAGQSSLQPHIDRLASDLAESQSQLEKAQVEIHNLTEQRLGLTARLEQFKAQAGRVPVLESHNRQLQDNITSLNRDIATVQTRLQEQQRLNQEQKSLIDKAQENLTVQFKNLAQNILDEKTQKFTQQNQHNLKATLTPLQQQLGQFQELIRKTHQEGAEKQSVLLREIENLKQLNLNISEEARNLTRALTADSKTQGNWGELVLERVLESSGLQKGREYETQKSFSQNGRRYQPDVIIHLPEGKSLIIDAKVSLTAYERFRTAEDATEKQRYLKAHIQSLRTHAQQLANKGYQTLEDLHTLDMVIMFVPVEPAYLEAMNSETSLLEDAFNQGVLMLSPTNLLATLRTVATLWQNEKRNQNALEIARQAGALYDKFVGFCADLNDIKQRLDQADAAWHKAENKLTRGRGNLVKATKRLQDLGAKTKKQLDAHWLEQQAEDEDPPPGSRQNLSPVSSKDESD